ncbi:K00134 GAPDH, gapA; glyceraldehyde 3-phosphate dehydrogenase (phosphorylating) [Candidatus Pelagibacterales bacterium]
MKTICGLNGFGRFGIHLLKYWLENISISEFEIKFINDDTLDQKNILKIIQEDKKINFSNYKVSLENEILLIKNKKNKNSYEITCTHTSSEDITWIGKPKIFFEASGKHTSKNNCLKFLKNNTSHVIISATSHDADQTLIYSYNHDQFEIGNKVISYGSCTVNAYVPFAAYINKHFYIKDSSVNIIHNIPGYKLDKFNTIEKRICTLEKSGPKLLSFLNNDNFNVEYSLIPYTGVSSIDLRFSVQNKITLEKFIKHLKKEIDVGELKNIYGYSNKDSDPNNFNLTKNSMEIIIPNIAIKNQNIYVHGYFDNENSVNRFFDLSNYIIKRLSL